MSPGSGVELPAEPVAVALTGRPGPRRWPQWLSAPAAQSLGLGWLCLHPSRTFSRGQGAQAAAFPAIKWTSQVAAVYWGWRHWFLGLSLERGPFLGGEGKQKLP